MASSSWTEERVAILKAALELGMSATQAGENLGVTRNAVIGKAARLGIPLTGNRWAGHTPGGPPRPRKPRPTQTTPRIPPFMPKSVKKIDPVEAAQDYLLNPPGTLLSLFDLSKEIFGGTCRWPIGEPNAPEFGFCGKQACPASVYCPYHDALSYQPTAARRDRRSPFRA